jgi:hypothetical protein
LSGGPDAVPGVLLRARAWARASYDDRVLSSGLDRDQSQTCHAVVYSALMPAALMIGHHLSISALCKA